MANTTNYNWETPDDTDLVKDGAAAIRTLGNSVDTTTKALNPETTLGDIAYRSATSNTNTRLPIGTSGQILAVSAGVPAWINNDQGDITEVAAGTGISVASGTGPVPTVSIDTAVTADLTTAQTLTNKTLTSPVLTTPTISTIDAKGDLLVGTADNTIGRLAVGTNGHTLVADSTVSPTGLKWAAPAAGGKVLQVVTAFKSDTFTTTSISYTDITGLSVTITPTLATSKIYVIANVTGAGAQGQAPGMVQILRGATVIGNGDTAGSRTSGFAALGRSGGATEMASAVINFVDSPATTSATTYKIQGNALISGNTLFINRCESATDDASRVRGSSTITVLEIGA